MKKTVFLFVSILIASCIPGTKAKDVEVSEKEMMAEVPVKKIPATLTKVYDAHGGLDNWKTIRTLSYVLPKGDNAETHIVDLWSRKDRINSEKFSMGFDGKEVWLLDLEENYKGDARFYHNLMFYFYAMPFVLADDGIIYSDTDDLVFDEVSYPGVRISYKAGVGTSPKDEYFIHYDPNSYKMAWLGYTVTYRTGEKSNTIKWIRYDDWQTISGLVLPKSITWHNFEGSKILDARSTVSFENVMLDKNARPDDFYAIPENGKYIKAKKN